MFTATDPWTRNACLVVNVNRGECKTGVDGSHLVTKSREPIWIVDPHRQKRTKECQEGEAGSWLYHLGISGHPLCGCRTALGLPGYSRQWFYLNQFESYCWSCVIKTPDWRCMLDTGRKRTKACPSSPGPSSRVRLSWIWNHNLKQLSNGCSWCRNQVSRDPEEEVSN